MSQEVISQKIKRTCDSCGAVKEWELVGLQESTIIEMQDWYTIIREIFVDGQFTKIMTQACSLACVPAAAVKLTLSKFEEQPADNIDLASLHTSNMTN